MDVNGFHVATDFALRLLERNIQRSLAAMGHLGNEMRRENALARARRAGD